MIDGFSERFGRAVPIVHGACHDAPDAEFVCCTQYRTIVLKSVGMDVNLRSRPWERLGRPAAEVANEIVANVGQFRQRLTSLEDSLSAADFSE